MVRNGDDADRTARQGNRRGFLILGAAAAVIFGAPSLPRLWQRGPALSPHPSAPGFRQAGAAEISGAVNPFAGIDTPGPGAIAPAPVPDICAALYRDGSTSGRAQAAFFTDIACPFCRAMEPWIAALPPDVVEVTWHDLPLLGPPSIAAARAIAAAGRQGRASEMRARLTRTRFQPGEAYLTALAGSLDLDPARLIDDMASPEVEARVAETLGLAEVLRLPGTPAFATGDIVAVGRRDRGEIDALIAAAGPPPCG